MTTLLAEIHPADNATAHPAAHSSAGWIHSYETSAGQDGPGWRFVLFFSGCLLRCLYCHNPDTWKLHTGTEMSVDEVWAQVSTYLTLLKRGGITLTGGEPLVQAPFVKSLLRRFKENGLHTALDTAGFLGARVDEEMMRDIDVVLLDIKCWNPETYKHLTGVELHPTLVFARRLAEAKRPVWLRYVLVPGITDVPEEIDGLAAFAASLGNVERVDVLPFHQLGKSKWEELHLHYSLKDVKPPSHEETARAIAIFASHGLNAC